MRKITVADCETDPFKKGRTEIRPFLWGFYDGQTYHEFEDTIDFIAHIYDLKVICYAHNGGKFDWLFLMDYIDPFSEVMIINGRLSKFKIGECEFRDSYNILPTSLATYQKTEISYDIFEADQRHKPKNWKKIQDYLYDDCVDLYEYVTGFIERFGLCLTQAGAAMKQWKVISGREPPKDDGGVLYEAFKKYYYGGRCQSFVHGVFEKPFKMIDINSAYPFAMLSQHPISLDHFEISYEDWMVEEDRGPYFLTITGTSQGGLPYRGKDGSLFFPNDDVERTYHVTGWELVAALDTGTVTVSGCSEVWGFYETIDFSDYILHFYEERQKAKQCGDKLGDIFCKLLMNSLYGKFGSNPEQYRSYMIVPPDCIGRNGTLAGENRRGEEIEWEWAGEFGEQVLVSSELDEIEQTFYNVATAASITGYVRAFLWRALCGCKEPLYCDTDSIAALDVGDIPNGFGDALGQWGIDGEFLGGAFGGRKLYAMEYVTPVKDKKGKVITHKVASKGTRLKASEIYKIANGGEVLFEPESPTFSVHKPPSIINRRVRMVKKELTDFD